MRHPVRLPLASVCSAPPSTYRYHLLNSVDASGFELTHAGKNTPVRHFHGEEDGTVRIEWARASEAALKKMGVQEYELVELAGLAHSASMEEIDAVLSWLKEVIPPIER